MLHRFKLCYYYTQKLAANTCCSGSYELLHKVVSCTHKTSSCGLTGNLPFWVTTVDLNKYWVEYRWLTGMRHYVYYGHTYIHTHTHTHIYIYIYIYIFLYIYISWPQSAINFRKKLRADWGQEMLAIIRYRVVCLPGCYPKTLRLRYIEL